MFPTTHRERKKEKNRNDIIECAVSLFQEKGFVETSIDEIIEKADISRGTLYNYFPDKESILAGYFQNKVMASSEAFLTKLSAEKGIRAKLDSLLDFMYEILADDLELAGVYFRYRMKDFGNSFEQSQRSGMETLIVDLIKTAQENGEIRADVPALVIAKNFHFLFMSFFIFNTQEKMPAKKPMSKGQVIELFLNGASAK